MPVSLYAPISISFERTHREEEGREDPPVSTTKCSLSSYSFLRPCRARAQKHRSVRRATKGEARCERRWKSVRGFRVPILDVSVARASG